MANSILVQVSTDSGFNTSEYIYNGDDCDVLPLSPGIVPIGVPLFIRARRTSEDGTIRSME